MKMIQSKFFIRDSLILHIEDFFDLCMEVSYVEDEIFGHINVPGYFLTRTIKENILSTSKYKSEKKMNIVKKLFKRIFK